jgi:phosphate-selective porin OprO/OprP
MKVTVSFLMTVALTVGVSANALAQYSTPNMAYATPSPYYAANAGDLESRLSQLETALEKKQDKTDSKKKFTATPRGRVFIDSVNYGHPVYDWQDGGSVTAPANNLGLRDARIGVNGEGFGIFDYTAEIRYSDQVASGGAGVRITDVFVGVKNVPGLDYVRVGHFKVETGMSYVASSRNSTAMERTTAVQLFSPQRRFGVGQTFYFANDKVRWFNGIFASRNMDSTMYVNDNNQGMIYNSRFTCVPVYAKEGAKYLHFGGHYMYQQNPDDTANMATPGNARTGGFSRGQSWYSVSVPAVSQYNQGGIEMAWGKGPLAFASEFFAGSYDKGRDIYGGYVEVRYFLTGDHRAYDKKLGVLGNVKTKKNLDCVKEFIKTHHHGIQESFLAKSLGAWELFAQWNFTDTARLFYVDGIQGGRTVDTVLGVKWYWNPNTRMMFEYVHTDGTRLATGGSFRATEDIFAASFRFSF